MGSYASEVQIYNANGLHFANGAIYFENSNQLNDGDVNSLANGRVGSFWFSQVSAVAFLSPTSGDTQALVTIGPL
jgi:hypothetical protein